MDYTRAAGGCFIITPDMQEHRNAWGTYFTLKGNKRQLKSMKKWLRGELGWQHGYQFAVPAEWPWQFDQSVDEGMCR